MNTFFLPVAPGHRFCVFHPADERARKGGVLYVHPFAEEMNKSRRMAALQARAFARAGWDVLLMDLYGCGDSSGDFRDATWDIWQRDVDTAWRWLMRRVNGPVWLWGLRLGAMLAATAAVRSDRAVSLLLWQPVISGHRFVQHFVRSRIMSDALAEKKRSTTGSLLAELVSGGRIEVAGYEISPDLLLPIDGAALCAPPAGSIARWFEITDAAAGAPSPGIGAAVASWRAAGVDATATPVAGPPFWQTQEISESTALIEASTSMLSASDAPTRLSAA